MVEAIKGGGTPSDPQKGACPLSNPTLGFHWEGFERGGAPLGFERGGAPWGSKGAEPLGVRKGRSPLGFCAFIICL